MTKRLLMTLAVATAIATTACMADEAAPMRRPCDVNHPMFLVHIDTWNYPDPQKIIQLIPEDVKPWCVFNISLSVSHNEDTGVWNLVRDGIATAHSWVRACAENQVWCTVQPSSGGFSHFPDGQMDVYEDFFRDYPNFLGFNYCEQFWGFNDQFSVTLAQRLSHFAQLMELSVSYGGYLFLSWCGGIWHHNTNPVAMFKQNGRFLKDCREHPDNLVMCFKYTSATSWYNNESVCLGTFISGLINNYGIRYDECGWALGDGETYPTAVGIGAVMENIQLTGMTVFDGPELIWRQCFRENGTTKTSDGYTSRRWQQFAQYDNIWIDMWRMMTDGTLRLPTRREVMEKTQLVITQDVGSGSNQEKYAAPANLYDGLYKQDGEGSFDKNTHWFKKTGRYGAIPVVVGLYDTDATVIPVRIRQSQYRNRWSTTQAKVDELNRYAPQEYEGTLYAGRMKNAWVTYYPFRYGQSAWASIPFKYNTCDRMELTYSEYSAGLIHEYADHVDFYLNNYRVDSTQLKTDEIRIYGANSRPALKWSDRSSHERSSVTDEWVDGVYVVKVAHCGAVELTIDCSGSATDRLSTADIEPRKVEAPQQPPVYTGPRQHEAECFDYKNIAGVVTRPNNNGTYREGCTGQGYLNFGTDVSAMVKDTVTVPVAGNYRVTMRYQAPDADARHTMLLVNSTAIRNGKRIEFPKTEGDEWSTASLDVTLREGVNVVYMRAYSPYGTPQNLVLDNMVVTLIDDISTVVEGVARDGSVRSVYDLQGRRTAATGRGQHRGLYVVDGKKRVLK